MLYDIEKSKKRTSLNGGIWDDFMNRDLFEDSSRTTASSIPAVNIIENKKEFLLELASPGMCKDNYTLEIDRDVLTISGELKNKNVEAETNYTRREFRYTSFSRSFMLPEYVDEDKIAASCADGILTIHIPKHEGAAINRKREIAIA